LQKIGSLVTPILDSLEVSTSRTTKLETRPTSSGISGFQNPALEAERLIGLLRGGTGSDVFVKLPPSYSTPVDEPVMERVLRRINSGRLLSAMLPDDLTKIAGGPEKQQKTALRVEALLSHYAEQAKDPSVIKLVVADWLNALEPFPFYAIDLACRQWLISERGQYRPSVSDIVRKCEVFGVMFIRARTAQGANS